MTRLKGSRKRNRHGTHRPRHHVYAVELADHAWNEASFRQANPRERDPTRQPHQCCTVMPKFPGLPCLA